MHAGQMNFKHEPPRVSILNAAINFRPQLLINILETCTPPPPLRERFKESRSSRGPRENESSVVRLSSLFQREIYCDSAFNCIEKSAIHLVGTAAGSVHLNEAA